MDSNSSKLEVFFLPFLAPGHMIPMIDTARLFAAHGVKVTIIITTFNALRFQSTIDKDFKAGRKIQLHVLRLPFEEVGLPEGVENFTSLPNLDLAPNLFAGMNKLQPQIEKFIRDSRPNCIISDMFYPWTADLAIELGIPRLVFHVSGFISISAIECVRIQKPHLNVKSDSETFELPGFPGPIEMTRLKLSEDVITPNHYSALLDGITASELRSYGSLVNSFYELEPAYSDYYNNTLGRKALAIGPVSLWINKDSEDKSERGNNVSIDKNSILSWLDTKKPNSVVYVSFGTLTRFETAQLLELARGLEAAGHPFIWVVGMDEKAEDGEKWLPEGFEERMLESKKGLIIRGWAPQVLILDHQAIGGFITHCGWNSVLECVVAGVPMATWPLSAEQFYHEKLVSTVLKIGVEVGVEEWSQSIQSKHYFVKSEKIEKAVTQLMGSGKEAKEIRRRIKELSGMAKRAVEEGGSSCTNLTTLIEELKLYRSSRKAV